MSILYNEIQKGQLEDISPWHFNCDEAFENLLELIAENGIAKV